MYCRSTDQRADRPPILGKEALMLTITHTRADGTMIDGTSRGDGTAPILKANGWSRGLGTWCVPASRDPQPVPISDRGNRPAAHRGRPRGGG